MVEDLDSRMNEDQQELLVRTVTETLPYTPPAVEEAEAEPDAMDTA